MSSPPSSLNNGDAQASKADDPQQVTAIFSIKDRVGALDDALQVFKEHNISLSRIESRPSLSKPDYDYDFYVDFRGVVSESLRAALNEKSADMRILQESTSEAGGLWFPRKISDLDVYANKVLSAGAELESDHPGFSDKEYRERRMMRAEIALKYRYGEPIPRIDYTQDEIDTWGAVYRRVRGMYETHACKQHRQALTLLEQNCGYGPDNIPQLEDISRFLQDCTGFRLRPVAGLLSSRDFLNGLAFRTFHSTQYIRHHSKPLYTPEPDVCHELMGHVPLFADREFADFSQQIGLASLGASDEFVEQLATCYWFTVEFGLCREDGELKAYGAGLLSSFGELEYCLSDKPEVAPFDPYITGKTKYPITEYQPKYFVAESFADATRLMREFAAKSDRPFTVRYNPFTMSIEVLDTLEKLSHVAESLQAQAAVLTHAMRTIASSQSK